MKRKLETDEDNSNVKIAKSVPFFKSAFRKNLKTNNGINALNEFVLASKEKDVVTEYINAGGSAEELVGLLKQFDGKKDLIVASTVFAALQLIVVKTVDDLLLIQNNVEKACEELLCTYHVTMQNMLCPTSPTSYKKIVLKLLTSMVTLNAGLAKKILSLFPINLKLLKALTDSRASNIQLRTSFIHYLLSFLIDDNVGLISELLKIKGLLVSIVPGLANDEPETVILVLNTFRLKIVENVKISKTLKIHTFNTPILRCLAKLYDYKSANASEELTSDADLSTAVQSVRLTVHSLLMLLCTSLKKGMLFRERGLVSGKSPNQLILTLLEDMNGPWRDELKSQLVTEILKVCPEFLKIVFNQLESSLQPNSSADWRKLIVFLKQIIEKQELTIEIQKEQASVVTSTFFPTIVQKLLRDHCDDKILHHNSAVRFHILSVLEVCLRKISSFLEQYSFSQQNQSTLSALKDHIEQFLSKNSVSCITLIDIWNASANTINDEERLDVSEYYHSLANVLLFYNQLCPMSFKQLEIKEDINLEEVNFCNAELQFKRAQLIYFILNPKPLHDQFPSLLRQFICSRFDDEKGTKIRVLENMFSSTGFFDGFVDEVLIWMYCIHKIPIEHTTVISDLLVDVFVAASKGYKNFSADVRSVIRDDDVFFENTVLTTDLEYFVDIDDGLGCNTKPIILISPVVPALLSVLKKYEKCADKRAQINSVKLFVLRLLVHLLHLQSNSKGLIALLQKYSSSYVDPLFYEYLGFWGHDKLKPKSFIYPLSDEETALRFSAEFVKTKREEESLPLHDVTDTECILLWNLCTFYSVQLNHKHLLDKERCAYVKNVFSAVREKLSFENRIRCLRFVINDLNFIDDFNLTGEIRTNSLFHLLLDICGDFRNHDSLPSNYSTLLSPYRKRLILFLLTKQRQNEPIRLSLEAITVDDIIQFVMLNSRTTALLLNTFTMLPLSLMVDDEKQLSEWCIVIQNLLQISAKYLQHSTKNENLLRLLSKIKKLLASDVNVDSLETSIIKYLESFPHQISSIPEEISENLIKCNPSVDKLALHLLPYHSSVWPIFLDKISELGKTVDINELLKIARKVTPISSFDHILETIYTHQYSSLISWIDDCKWELQYANLVSEIFQKYADAKTCNRLCTKIINKWPVKSLNAGTCSVMNVVFKIASQTDEFVRLLISSITDTLSSTGENINWFCASLSQVIEIVDDLNFLPDQDMWENFVKSALKISLQSSNSILLRTLRQICEKALTTEHTAETSAIFQMTISHSEFVNIILGDSEIKCELIEFYSLLTNKNKSLMSSNHIPLLLGAYGASLSKSDQLLLQVLQWYEANKIRFSDCKPYLWGDAAVNHYSIRTEISVSLKRQPQPNQVLDLLNINTVKNTIRYVPLDRDLNPEKELHVTEVDVYDLSFVLPLMSHLLAPESRVSIQKFTRSGALALVLVALSSREAVVRMAGFHCLQRFQSHLNSREKEIQVWDHFINALRNGVLAIQSEDADTPPTLPCIVANFLAHMSLIISEPLHSLYVPLTNFLLAKPSFDVNTIPNFLALFYSTDLKNRDHQEWILRIIRDGMRSEQDWITAQRCFLFKLILQYYSSASSSETTNVLVLEIMNNALKIPGCKANLVTKFGVLSWLNQIIQNSSDFNKHFLSCFVNMLQSLKTVNNTSNVIFTILVLLRKLHSKIVDHQCIENVFEVLSSLYYYEKKNVLTKNDIEFIIDFAVPYHDSRFDKICRNCIIYSSVVGVGEYDSKVTNYIISIIQRFLSNK